MRWFSGSNGDRAAAGDAVFAPRMKALVLRAVILARRRFNLEESTRLEYHRRWSGI